MATRRCGWADPSDERMLAYHDREWGLPSHDDRHLFEMLTLEGAQAGLSWRTILNKREGYRRAFSGFDAAKVARFDARTVERLLLDPGIVRNRLKVESTVANARAILDVRDELGSLDAYLWSFVGGAPIRNRWRALGEIPAETAESRTMSKELKRRGFRFGGTDRLLRVHAGDRHGARSHTGVLQVRGACGARRLDEGVGDGEMAGRIDRTRPPSWTNYPCC